MLIMCIDRDSRVLAYTVSPKRLNLMSILGLTLTFLYISQAGLVHVYFNQSAGNFICLLKLNSNSLSYFAEHTTHFLQKLFFVRKECVLFTTMIFFFFFLIHIFLTDVAWDVVIQYMALSRVCHHYICYK